MMSTWLRAPRRALQRIALPALAALLAVTIVACGGGGYTPSPLSVTDKRPLPAEFTSRKAASYSPYRTSQSEGDLNSEVIVPANVLQDLRLVQAAGIGTIRLFSSKVFGDLVLSTIRSNNLNLKVMLGSYVNLGDETGNQTELQTTITLANQYSDIVLAVSVGNERMADFTAAKIPPATMARYIKQVRDAVRQPVTTDDNWYFWATAPTTILDVVDFAAVHTYPLLDTFYDPKLWDWRQAAVPADQRAAAMMQAGLTEAKRQFGQARDYLDRAGLPNLPMVIGETGWTATDPNGDPSLPFRAHPVNQKMYYDLLVAWAAEPASKRGPAAIFYFEAFDEQWKGGDDGWGLFTKDRAARCVVQGLNAESATWVYDKSASCAATAAVYFVPAVVTDPLPADKTLWTLFSDAPVAANELVASGQQWDAFGNPKGGVTADYPPVSSTAAPGDGSVSLEITPKPADYGWGLLRHFNTDTSANLSGFAGGAIKFWIKTNNYPGKIEVAVFTDTDDRAGAQAFVQFGPGEYGYCNTNTWCQVTIPVSKFVAANPLLDLRLVTSGFVISDRYDFTGKPQKTTGLPKVYIDGISWTR